MAINKANYFCQKLENRDFWILKILNIWTTLTNGMETFESGCVFEELVKIGGGARPFDFYLEGSFDVDKYQNFSKID